MRYDSTITLGQVVQSLSPIMTGLIVIVFGAAVYLGDAESTKQDVQENRNAIVQEAAERKAEDQRLEAAFRSRADEIKEQIQESEQRTIRILGEVRSDVQWLVREKASNGTQSASE